jgi:hypothetical protein
MGFRKGKAFSADHAVPTFLSGDFKAAIGSWRKAINC